MNQKENHKEQNDLSLALDEVDVKELIVFNDDVNTFDHVTATLLRSCKHTQEQAEQCTWLIHHKGKCTVKLGSLDKLKPMCSSIVNAGIKAAII